MVDIDKQQACSAFSRAAERYDEVAVLQRETGQRLVERLDLMLIEPKVILDIGSGTGVATAELAKRYKKAQIVALDFAFPMLLKTRKRGSWLRRPRCVCADLEHLPFADGSVDLIYSNAALQWSNDLEHTFGEFMRVLRPGGLVAFTTFGPDTLKELRMAWSEADGGSHVSQFLDMHDVGDALVSSRFAEPVIDVDRMVLTYDRVDGLMQDLKVLGAHNVNRDRSRGLTGKSRMLAMRESYEQFRSEGKLPASYEVIYGHAWVPDQPQEDSVTMVPISNIKRM
ncbi:MAG: malonyl-ACP O-methyltransferase BioC [Gammaproteobacteria bacterium]|nr:malonyl-ACP O-methyltransferase BioC [Gammaproteobacteria bacterium]